MKKNIFTQRFAAWLLAAVLLSSVSLGILRASTTKAGDAPATEPRLDMVTALKAGGRTRRWATRRSSLTVWSEPGKSSTPTFRRTAK